MPKAIFNYLTIESILIYLIWFIIRTRNRVPRVLFNHITIKYILICWFDSFNGHAIVYQRCNIISLPTGIWSRNREPLLRKLKSIKHCYYYNSLSFIIFCIFWQPTSRLLVGSDLVFYLLKGPATSVEVTYFHQHYTTH